MEWRRQNLKNKIMLSIHPEFVEEILNKEKEYEYRRKIPKKPIEKIYIYATFPVKKVVAEATVSEIIKLPPKELWEATQNKAGVDEEYFNKYFSDSFIGYAYKLSNIKIYEVPLDVSSFGLKNAPQSFVYLD